MDSDSKLCRICFDSESKDNELITPCKCKGTSKYIHRSCLNKWIDLNYKNIDIKERCSVCNYKYRIKNEKDTRIITILLTRFTKRYKIISAIIGYILFCYLDNKYCYQEESKNAFNIEMGCSEYIGLCFIGFYLILIFALLIFYRLQGVSTDSCTFFIIKLLIIFLIQILLIMLLYPIGVFIMLISINFIIGCIFYQEIKNNLDPDLIILNYREYLEK